MLDYKEIYQKEHIENELTYSQIREKYNIPRGTWDYWVRKKFRLRNDHRKYRANDTFFSNIDTEIKAYLLGFLYADGYITNDGRIGCRLTADDDEIIKLIQKYIAVESPIRYTNYQNIKRRPQVVICWKSKQMYKDLLKLGFHTDKTHINSNIFSFIPENLKLAFIRGYCDGDGSIRFTKHPEGWYRCSVIFCNGCPKILEDVKEFFENSYNICGKIQHVKNFYRLVYEKVLDAAKISYLLYNNANFYLTRKYNSAKEMINYRTNTELTGKNKKFLVV